MKSKIILISIIIGGRKESIKENRDGSASFVGFRRQTWIEERPTNTDIINLIIIIKWEIMPTRILKGPLPLTSPTAALIGLTQLKSILYLIFSIKVICRKLN